ncbi:MULTISPECIES: hypothetical protein [unclassified Pseudomonas]|uniref:hypothetical protein n=1 Tax=unclassified Pseudomonas TaxID=196821 RepID=UPI000C882780|nr:MULTISPECIES: hypothetical protein [unclassified Pseudomonas]PMZ89155.1 hypothetical protein C1X61_11505 [Pseudomonas sp. FW215-T2]PNA11855.1 hypothetical protein C1X62_14405 [Pseudomonas sp. FW215-R3]PNB37615.1 hypothetical protein C1X63_11645 [Pseudomonas sp. FW305-131]
MVFYETELEGNGLEVNLESPEFEGVAIDYYNFTKIVEPDQYDGLPLKDFGSGFEVRKEGGVFLKIPDEAVLAALATDERKVLFRHPKGRPAEPVLAFPFTLRELKVFLDWAANVGHEVPINGDALLEVIEAQKTQPTLDASSSAIAPNQSDASLGEYYRKQNRDFAERNQERHEARDIEHQRWRNTADEIQRLRKKPASLRELAVLVKERLNLPDSQNTIRKRLGKQSLGNG